MPAAVLNETGVLGIRATSPKARKTRLTRCFHRHAAAEACAGPPAWQKRPSQLCRSLCCVAPAAGGQPFVGMLDCGASFSALNWQVSLEPGSCTLVDVHFAACHLLVSVIGTSFLSRCALSPLPLRLPPNARRRRWLGCHREGTAAMASRLRARVWPSLGWTASPRCARIEHKHENSTHS